MDTNTRVKLVCCYSSSSDENVTAVIRKFNTEKNSRKHIVKNIDPDKKMRRNRTLLGKPRVGRSSIESDR